MNHLPEKFDHLPQDFDRMAIWKGIETPKRSIFPRIYFWSFFFALASVGLFFIIHPKNSFSPIDGKSSILEEARSLAEECRTSPEGTYFRETNQNFNPSAKEKKELQLHLMDEGQDVATSTSLLENDNQAMHLILENGFQGTANRGNTKVLNHLKKHEEEISTYLAARLDSELGDITSPEPRLVSHALNSRKQSLSLRAGIGRHSSDFQSFGEEDAKWRNSLEKSQLDYALGLRYEKSWGKNFLLSLTGSYHLYKDQIDVTYIRNSMGQETQVHYDLHNHYHVFSGQVELGKRFYQKGFFCDVMGGMGVKVGQVSEVDYFVGEDELANKEEVNKVYRRSTDVFATAQTAVGKHLGDRIFVRMGGQIHAGLDLTGSQSSFSHRMLAANAFLEAGLKF